MFLENILGNWKQKVLLNGLTSNWENIHTDAPTDALHWDHCYF